jgi:LmbE family N-acetylglucosaminyl deacetylase
VIDVHPYVKSKFDALRAHRTQIKRDSPFLLLPDDLTQQYLGVEGFRRAQTRVAAPDQEDDLFAGLRSPAPHRTTIGLA